MLCLALHGVFWNILERGFSGFPAAVSDGFNNLCLIRLKQISDVSGGIFMGPGLWIALGTIAVGVIIFLVVLLEFIFRALYNRGTNALGNARRRHKNATQGPVIERLYDLYPEIAAQHQQNGTATAMNPALLRSDIPIIPATQPAKK
jgi:hypothetical protein